MPSKVIVRLGGLTRPVLVLPAPHFSFSAAWIALRAALSVP